MNNLKENKKDVYRCDHCNKNYKTYKTLWEHNKKFHKNNINRNQLLSTNDQPIINQLSTKIN